MDARSPTLLHSEVAAERAADTWRAPREALAAHQCCRRGLASERGRGLGAGSQAACAMALGVAAYCHECRDRCEVRHHLERKAYAAMGQEDDAAPKVARATREATLAQRLHQYDPAPHACAQAMALYDQRALLRHVLREAWPWCSPHGRLRTGENVRAALTLLFDLSAALDCPAIPPTRKPLRTALDDLVAPFVQAEARHAARRAVGPHDA